MTKSKTKNKLKILFVASEVVPFAKTGGLADVAGALPQALKAMGHDVRIVMPKYKSINHDMKTIVDFPVAIDDLNATAIIRESVIKCSMCEKDANVPIYFVDNHWYFYRSRLYAYEDEAERFGFFCRAILEMLPLIKFKPDIIHCNDWQSGPIPVLLKDQYRNTNPFYQGISTVFTIHNLQYQGSFPKECLNLLRLSQEYFSIDKLEFYGEVNYMKAGLMYADIINTVSKTYAKEIQTSEYGERMEGILQKRAEDIYGIVNGIHFGEADPATDDRIVKNYSAKDFTGKKLNKYALQEEMSLPKKDVPVIGLISRLASQKGFDIIAGIIDELLNLDIQFVILGSGEAVYEDMFKRAKEKYPDKVGLYLGFNANLAQHIYAGSDMFLMPSRFEPCGLGQLFALRYGSIPVVRSTGGLADTIVNFNEEEQKGNGFAFTEYSSQALRETIFRALDVYNQKPKEWNKLVKRALEEDFSWPKSAEEYVKLYKIAISKSKE